MPVNDTAATTVHVSIKGMVRLFSDGSTSGEELPLSSITAEFYANSFPSARIVIPVGKPADSDIRSETIKARELADRLRTFQRIEVVATMSGQFAPGKEWPTSEIRLFNGYVTGTSTARTANSIGVVVNATHWLLDLDASSTLSAQFVKGSSVLITAPAVGDGYDAYASRVNDPDLTTMVEDVWLEGLKKKFVRLCKNASLASELECATSDTDVQALNTEGSGGRATINLSNDVALSRLDGTEQARFDNDSVVDVPHLAFVEELDSALEGALTQAVSNQLYNATAGNSSIWDQLLGLAKTLHFAVIPTIDSAVCAPLSPCLAGEEPPRHVTIKASEYWAAQPSEGIFRVCRGLSLHGNYTSPWGSLTGEDIEQGLYFPSDGCYIAENDPDLPDEVKSLTRLGAIVYDRAPGWLDDKSMRAVLMRDDTNPDKNPTTSMQDPDDVAANADEFVGPPAPYLRDDALAKRLGDQYAKWRYWNDTLLSRTGQITGKFRLDIAPGTIVRIEDIDGKLYEDPAEFGYMYAQVTGVQFGIDAANKQAYTTLMLSHIRREGEKKMGTDGHPLYQELWVGTVLQNVEMSSGSAGSEAAESTFVPVVGSHELKPR